MIGKDSGRVLRAAPMLRTTATSGTPAESGDNSPQSKACGGRAAARDMMGGQLHGAMSLKTLTSREMASTLKSGAPKLKALTSRE